MSIKEVLRIYKKKTTLIFHIGMPKCASSSIQKFLSSQEFLNIAKKNYRYVVITSDGDFIQGEEVVRVARQSPYKYMVSIPASLICENIDKFNFNYKGLSYLLKKYRILIFSNEGWSAEKDYFSRFYREFIKNIQKITGYFPTCRIIAFIRPQIEFLNSAFWQWGAWVYSSFDEYLKENLESANWYSIINAFEAELNLEIDIIPLEGNAIIDFVKYLQLDIEDNIDFEAFKWNTSLPEVVLRLYQRNRELRPGPHDSLIDFVVNNVLTKYPIDLKPTPWVIDHETIKKLIEYYRPFNEALVLKIKDQEFRERILKNPKWWDAEAYREKVVKPITDQIDYVELEKLCVTLLKALRDGEYNF